MTTNEKALILHEQWNGKLETIAGQTDITLKECTFI